ncbi:C69 family dipeptidase [Endozoicomonas sp. Mp262]|uniref:C69 family dipeptidase n=1 Tax=Endozoicomonas sp. Mp262 TaxID=2919499 RepID=UPI0021D82A02
MTLFKKRTLAAAISSLVMLPLAQACTSVIVGKDASASGALMISRNEDFSTNNWAKRMHVYPRKSYKAGDVITLSNGLKVPAPETSWRYTAMNDWDAYQNSNDGKVFEERGVNEFNLAMSATNSAEMNEKAQKVDPLVDQGIIEQNMTGLILSQAKSAREAVQLLGDYVTRYGAGEANGVQFADTKEAWYMEIGSGHHWIAVKVPDDKYAVIANGLRIHDVDLGDTQNIMHSKGLLEFTRKHKLLSKPDSRNFNFAQAFGKLGDLYNTDREWMGQNLLSASVKQKIRQDQYPLFLKPDQKISVTDIAKVLRSDYQGTQLKGKGKRPIGVDRTSEAHIIEMYPNMPGELAAVIWQTPSNINYSPFIPVYNVMSHVPKVYTQGKDHYDNSSAWWTFRSLGTLASPNVMEGKYKKVVDGVIDSAEHYLVKTHAYTRDMLKHMYKDNQDMAIQYASNYSNGLLQTAYDRAQFLQSELMTDLTRSTEKKYSPEEFDKIKKL